MSTQKATFGAGCFWGVESLFRQVPGVIDAAVGHAGGTRGEPDLRGRVRRRHRPRRGRRGGVRSGQGRLPPGCSEVFFANHDPTTLNRQGPDVGDQYRSGDLLPFARAAGPGRRRQGGAGRRQAVAAGRSSPRSRRRRPSTAPRPTTSATSRSAARRRTATCHERAARTRHRRGGGRHHRRRPPRLLRRSAHRQQRHELPATRRPRPPSPSTPARDSTPARARAAARPRTTAATARTPCKGQGGCAPTVKHDCAGKNDLQGAGQGR